MSDFDTLIKDIETEIEALKTVKRKSSLTMMTIQKTITGTATIDTSLGFAVVATVPFIKFIPHDPSNQFVFGYALKPYVQRNRNITVLPWTDGTDLGVVLIPEAKESDTGNITIDAIITATGDFDTAVSQITYHGA